MVKLSRQEIENLSEEENIVDDFETTGTKDAIDFYNRNEKEKAPNNLRPIITVNKTIGTIVEKDEKRGIILTQIHNKDGKRAFHLYDISGKKPQLIDSGKSIEYKDGLYLKVLPFYAEDRGDAVHNIKSRLFKLDDKNQPSFVTDRAWSLCENGWFEQSTGEGYSLFLCKANEDNTYKRVMKFSADMSGNRTISKDNVITDTLDRSDCYYKKTYQYDEDKNIVILRSSEEEERDGNWDDYEEDIPNLTVGDAEIYLSEERQKDQYTNTYKKHIVILDKKSGKEIWTDSSRHNNFEISEKDGKLLVVDKDAEIKKLFNFERNENEELLAEIVTEEKLTLQEKYADRRGKKSKYGTFYEADGYGLGAFVSNDGTENKEFLFGNVYDRFYGGDLTHNALMNVTSDSFSVYNGSNEANFVYDFKNDSRRDDLESVIDLGEHFFAAKKKGEAQFGIFEIADENMQTPLLMVDAVSMTDSSRANPNQSIVYKTDETYYRAEITNDGKLKPIARLKNNNLSISTGNKWATIALANDMRVDLKHPKVEISRIKTGIENGREYIRKVLDRKYYSNDELLKYAQSSKEATKNETIEPIKESYRNAKEIIMARRNELREKSSETKPSAESLPKGISPSKRMKQGEFER